MNNTEHFNQTLGIHTKKIDEFHYLETEDGNMIQSKILVEGQDGIQLIKLSFHNIFSLRMNFEGMKNLSSPALIITDISGNRWEDAKYYVEDYENGRLSFYCQSFEIIS